MPFSLSLHSFKMTAQWFFKYFFIFLPRQFDSASVLLILSLQASLICKFIAKQYVGEGYVFLWAFYSFLFTDKYRHTGQHRK